MGERKTSVNIPDDQKEFVDTLRQHLKEGRIQEASEMTSSEDNHKLIGRCSQELFAVLNEYINESRLDSKEFEYSRGLIEQIAANYIPEETLLELLEFAEVADLTGFMIYMKAIETCLHQMPRKHGTSMIWVCNTISHFLHEMPEEPEEPIVQLYSFLINMFKPFIEDIKSGHFEIQEKHRRDYIETIQTFVVKLLGKPLALMDLNKYKELSSVIFEYISVFNKDPLYYINCVQLCSNSVDSDYTSVSLLTFFNLVFTHNIGIESISHVYSLEFILESIMFISQDVLALREVNTQFKVCETLGDYLNRISNKTMRIHKIDSNVMMKFLEAVMDAMIYCDVIAVRQKCVQIYKKFIYLFHSDGRYKLILSLQKCDNPGLVGYGITILKEFISETLDSNEELDLKHFTGLKLKHLLLHFCCLDNDLIRFSDQTISILNLLRFVLIRDKSNTTSIQSYLNTIEDSFTVPLKNRIEEMRKEHVFEKERLIRSQECGEIEHTIMNCSVPIVDQLKGLDSSFTILDLMESLRARLENLIDAYKVSNFELSVN